MENTEILVHISAPSGVGDDARYRAQVEAILAFQSVSRQGIDTITLQSPNNRHDDTDDRPATITTTTSPESITRRFPSPTTISNVSHSGDELRESFVVPVQGPTAPIATPADAQAVPITAQENVSSGPPLVAATTTTTTAQDRKVPFSDASLSEKDHCLLDRSKDSLDSLISVIPDSQPEPSQGSRSSKRLSFVEDSSLTAKRHRANTPLESGNNVKPDGIFPSSAQYPEEPTSTATPTPTELSSSISLFTTLPLQIHPPLPPISNNQFTTHITPTLAMLTDRLKPSRTYKPITQTRELDTLERGHWLLHINLTTQDTNPTTTTNNNNTWPLPLFHRFWSFLSEFIAKDGRAGWGVWCLLEDAESDPDSHTGNATATPQHREHAEPSTSTTREEEDHGTSCDPRPLVLKIYAWGEIACHVYLLLFLASERRARKMGAQWRDGSGEVVIQMP